MAEDGIVLNLPGMIAGLPEEAYTTEFVPMVTEEDNAEEEIVIDEFGMTDVRASRGERRVNPDKALAARSAVFPHSETALSTWFVADLTPANLTLALFYAIVICMRGRPRKCHITII